MSEHMAETYKRFRRWGFNKVVFDSEGFVIDTERSLTGSFDQIPRLGSLEGDVDWMLTLRQKEALAAIEKTQDQDSHEIICERVKDYKAQGFSLVESVDKARDSLLTEKKVLALDGNHVKKTDKEE